jgi:glycosyltransferase involved in cell wall biosynthesis
MIMNMPLVSVIVPLYNHEAYIEECLYSIINQTYGYQNIELIVIDDFSTDNSREVVLNLKSKYDFKIILNKVNKGVTANINTALRIAKGEYVCITGSDDIWKHEKLKIQVDFMESNLDIGAASGNEIKIDSKGHPLNHFEQRDVQEATYEFEHVILRRFFFSSTLAIIRKSAIDKVGYYDTSLKVEDYYMWLKLTYGNFRIVTLSDVLGFYRIHSLNTNAKTEMIYDELNKILALYKEDSLYRMGMKRLSIIYFPKLALVNKRKAIQILPDSISLTRFFFRGLYYLLTPSKWHQSD